MNRVLHIAKDLSLPIEAITSRIGFTGQSESGKSYAQMKLAEEIILAGAQVIEVDPVGIVYGLKMGKDQRTAGLPIVVFGGMHADLPLTPESGRIVAEVLAEKRFSAVLDVSEFTMGELAKFTAAFAEHFFDAKKRNKSPVTVFWEEGQNFMPQELPPDPHAALMLNRVVRMVKVGRNYGIGNVIITQEPQAVSKRALSQVNCLFMGYMQGDKPRKAVRDWISDRARSSADLDLIAELPKLHTGQMFVAEPKWFGEIRRVHIAERQTFDSSRTPKLGEDAPEPGKIAAVDLRDLRKAMAAEIEKAEADPAFLRTRIAELEEQLKKKVARAAPAPKVQTKEVPVLKDGQLSRMEAMLAEGRKLLEHGEKVSEKIAGGMRELAQVVRPTILATTFENRPGQPQLGPPPVTAELRAAHQETLDRAHAVMVKALPRPPAPVSRPAVAPRAPAGGQTTGIGKGERRMLEVLARVHPSPLTRDQLGVLAGYKASGGTFTTYFPRLKKAGLVEEDRDRLTLTADGQREVPPLLLGSIRSPADLRELWRAAPNMGIGEWKIMEVLLAAAGAPMSRQELGERSGYGHEGGTFTTYLPRLKKIQLAIEGRDGVRVAPELLG